MVQLNMDPDAVIKDKVPSFTLLSDEEIFQFIHDLDEDEDAKISYTELERKLDQVHDEIAPEAKEHNLHHQSRDNQDRHQFLRSMLGTDSDHITTSQFAEVVKKWNIPSLKGDENCVEDANAYLHSMSFWRKMRAYWAVEGPEYLFMVLVASMIFAFAIWQMVKYIIVPKYRAALGWGVVLSKTNAGALYATFFFIIISMSRYLAALMRRSYIISRFINWDLSESFHVKISILGIVFSTLHAIGHLTGTFVHGSQTAHQGSVAFLFGTEPGPLSYVDYVRKLPGWTGLTALGMLYTVTVLSLPVVRKRNYEIFQLGHLLMYPIFGLLIAHGLAQLLQWAMLGYWLAIPVLLITYERAMRLANGFRRIPARLEILDDDTVRVIATIPKHRVWSYKAGQWVFLQVPQISLFQWHPFTISTCTGDQIQLHIKTHGNFVSKLPKLRKEPESGLIYVGIDGPFGAPAQRFYDFEQVIFFGAGIGVTPFSGILVDLQEKEDEKYRMETCGSSSTDNEVGKFSIQTPENSNQIKVQEAAKISPTMQLGPRTYRRIDFHWIVRDRNYLLWFSDLLNRLCEPGLHSPDLDIRVQTHVTQRRKNISTHIFRYMLEQHRTESHPASPLTGLLNPTHFGRPNLAEILNNHYQDMRVLFSSEEHKHQKRRVGVFFCGAPVIGHELADRCQALTLRSRADGSMIEYRFMMEVF
jgi:dual oxidase